jgi:iron(III) transport system permease protein
MIDGRRRSTVVGDSPTIGIGVRERNGAPTEERGPTPAAADPAAARGPAARLPRWRTVLNRASSVVVVLAIAVPLAAFVVAPIAYIFFGATRSADIGVPGAHFTWANLRTVVSTDYLQSFAGTLLLGLTVALCATAMGAVCAWLVSRTDLPGRRVLEVVIVAPIFLSPFLGAVAWIVLAGPQSGVINTFVRSELHVQGPVLNVMSTYGLVAVMSLYFMPYTFLFTSAALRNMDPAFEEASYMAGRGVLRTAVSVTLPLVRPALVASYFLIAILAAEMFTIPSVLITRPTAYVPVSVRVYRALSIPPSSAALASAIGVGLMVVAIAGLFAYQRSLRRAARFTTITARGYRPNIVRLRGLRYPAMVLCLLYGLVSIVLPYLGLIFMAFTPYLTTDLHSVHFTTRNFTQVLGNPDTLSALKNTLFTALVVASICLALACAVTYIVQRTRFRFRRVLEYVAVLPVAVPGIVFATGFIWAYVGSPIYATIWILIFAFIGIHLPQATRVTNSGFGQIDRALEEAAAMNGANRMRVFGRVTLPLAMPSVLAGWILIFILTVREMNVAIVLYAPQSPLLSVMTWNMVVQGDFNGAAIIGLLQTGVLVAVIIIARFVFRVRLTSLAGRQ